MFIKITTQFGAKNYSQDKINLIYDEVKNITQDDFNKVIMHLIGNSRISPNLQDFRRSISELGVRPKNNASNALESNRAVQIESITNFEFPVSKNMWANKKYIFIRGEKYPKFMMREDIEDVALIKKVAEAESRYIPIFKNLCDQDFNNGTKKFSTYYQELLKNFS
jgi:hypothetical protein